MLPNPYVILGALVGVLLLCITAFGAGHHYATLQEAEAIQKAQADAIAKTQAADQITHDVDVAAAQAQQKIHTITVETIKKVPIYVSKKAESACALPVGFVRVLDGSARNMPPVPDAAGRADDAAAGLGLADATATVAGNYGKYQQVAQQLRDLQAWVNAQAALRK